MNRILLIGSAGAGKSTLALKIAKKLKYPLFHLDRYFWQPGWKETPRKRWMENQHEMMKEDQWIIDGNYASTIEIRLKRADTVIFLDYSRWICVYRAIKRAIIYRNQNRPDMGEGCYEEFDWEFLRWIWNFPKRDRIIVLKELDKIKNHTKIFRFTNDRQVRKWFHQL